MITMRFLAPLLLLLLTPGFAVGAEAPTVPFSVIETHPHSTRDFTQGLLVHDGVLIESTGGYGTSQLHFRDVTGRTVKPSVDLPDRYFGEGIAVVGNALWQVTWRSRKGFVYDLGGRLKKQFAIAGEGWGLTSDRAQLFLSDGSAFLTRLDPRDARVIDRIRVHDGDREIDRLNELEFIEGWIFANVWQTDRIAIIHPQTGAVAGWLDLAELRQQFTPPPGFRPREHVLNGIAWDPQRRQLLVTGKCWPKLFALTVDWPPLSQEADKR